MRTALTLALVVQILTACGGEAPGEKLELVAEYDNEDGGAPYGFTHDGRALWGGSARDVDLKRLVRLDVETGGTTDDMRYTLSSVNCVGACALAPVVVVDEEYHPNMTAKKLEKQLKSLEATSELEGEELGYA